MCDAHHDNDDNDDGNDDDGFWCIVGAVVAEDEVLAFGMGFWRPAAPTAHNML